MVAQHNGNHDGWLGSPAANKQGGPRPPWRPQMPQHNATSPCLRLALAACLVITAQACSSSTSPGTSDSGPHSTLDSGPDSTPFPDGGDASSGDAHIPCQDCCEDSGACVWGEISKEIRQQSDCMCLLGCPHLMQNRTTRDRRQAQYDAHCYWGQDGQGNPCPVDECIQPPVLTCSNGHCAVADGGM